MSNTKRLINFFEKKEKETNISKSYDDLITACRNGSFTDVKSCVSYGLDFRKYNEYALFQAVVCHQPDIFEFLVEKGSDLHVENEYILRWACANGYTDMVKMLVRYGANIHVNNDFCLGIASKYGFSRIATTLLDNGANVHADFDKPLVFALKHGHFSLAKILVERGANLFSLASLGKKNLKSIEYFLSKFCESNISHMYIPFFRSFMV